MSSQSTPSRLRYRVFLPLTLVCLGIGLFLAQTGWLSSTQLWRLGATWPLFVIIAGLSLMVRRLVSPAAAALAVTAAFVILGSGAVVYAVAGPDIGGSVATVSASEPRGGLSTASLVIDASAVTVDITVGDTGANLYDAHVTGSSAAKPSITFDDSAATVTINTDMWDWWPFSPPRPTTVAVTLSRGVQWGITVNGAAVDGALDLQDEASSVRVNAASGNVDVALTSPHGSVPLQFNGAAVNADISVTTGASLRVTASGVAASITLDGKDSSGIGQQTWSDSGFPGAADRYDVTANGASAHVSVTHRSG